MSEQDNEADATFDPASMFKGVRDAQMQAWAKMMTDLVNTDAYAGASAEAVNAWLSSTKPLREMIESSVTQSLKSLNMAVGEDVIRIGERLTNIEMRLDDIEAKLDESLKNS